MSISLDTKGAIVMTNSGTGANAANTMTIKAPTSLAANCNISLLDPAGDSTLQTGTRGVYTLGANVATDTLTVAQSGYIILIPVQAQAQTVTLPPPTAGLNYEIIAQGTLAFIVAFQTTANNMAGNVLVSAGAAAASALVAIGGANRQINFTATAVIGDHVRLFSDGTKWYAQGQSSATAGLAFV